MLLPYRAHGQERKLTGAEVKRLVTGKIVTDEVHYTDRFKPGGIYESVFMNKRLSGTWTVKDGLLCVTIGAEPERCDEIWRAGNKLQRRRVGVSTWIDTIVVQAP